MKAKEYLSLINVNTKKGKQFAALAAQEPEAEVLVEESEAICYIAPDEDNIVLGGDLKIEEFGEYLQFQNQGMHSEVSWKEILPIKWMKQKPLRFVKVIVVGHI